MASRNRHVTPFASNHKTALVNKPTNPRLRPVDPNRKISTVPEMSPEARRAVLLAREDAKENNANSKMKEITLSVENNLDSNNNSTCVRGKGEMIRGERNTRTSDQSRTCQRTPNKNTKISSSRPPRGPNTGTSRSRSTLSQNEPPFSMSDNNEIYSHMGTNTTSNASVYTSNLSSSNNNNNNNGMPHANSSNNLNGIAYTNRIDDDPDDDIDSALPNDSFDEDDEEEDTAFKTNSFVLALDKALEKKEISRLKGDITDAAQISKPGTVRALNGGRLTNAQEVVVNVCHDDDTELVFHDDDEESIDTAKAISKIRVNIWMEYNSRFPPDNNLNDFDPPPHNFTDGNYKKEPETKQRPRPPVSAMKTREKSFLSNQRQGTSKDMTARKASGDSGSISSGANYLNSTSSAKRTSSNSRLRSVTPSPTPSHHGSGNSSRGKVTSTNSSSKPATPLRSRR